MASTLNTIDIAVEPQGLQLYSDASKLKTFDFGVDHNTQFYPDQSKLIGIIFAVAATSTSTIININ